MIQYDEIRFVFDPRHIALDPDLEDDVSFIDPLERRAMCAEGGRPMMDEAEDADSKKFCEV